MNMIINNSKYSILLNIGVKKAIRIAILEDMGIAKFLYVIMKLFWMLYPS